MSYFEFVRRIARAASTGAAMMQVSTKTELPTASSTNDCANSPTAISSSAVASDAIEILAMLMPAIRVFLHLDILRWIKMGAVRYTRPISELATSPAITIANSGVALNREYVNALTLRTPRSGYSSTLTGARIGSLLAMNCATDGLNE